MLMGDLSIHISRHEVACKCGCGFDTADIQLVNVLEACISHFEVKAGKRMSLHINSWNRCSSYNRTIGGVVSSMHTISKAVDFWISGASPSAVYRYLDQKYPNMYGIGQYNGRTHLDIRTIKARWDSR